MNIRATCSATPACRQGYKVYDKIAVSEDITLVGCLAHARRKFYEAKGDNAHLSDHALQLIGQIVEIEREVKEQAMSSEQIYAHRKIHTQPLFDQLIQWIKDEQHKILPQSPIGKAMSYTQSQWAKLIAVLNNGRLQIDNNLIEKSIRPLALGRKNYLFAGSHQGAQRVAMIPACLRDVLLYGKL